MGSKATDLDSFGKAATRNTGIGTHKIFLFSFMVFQLGLSSSPISSALFALGYNPNVAFQSGLNGLLGALTKH